MGSPNGSFLSSIRLSLVMVALCLADQTVLATVTPTLTTEFHSIDDMGWWTAAYLTMLSVFQIPYGKLYSLFSIKIVYLSAIGIFELGSLVCATAPNSIAMIFGRAIAGAGAAGIFTGGIMITTKIIPLDRRASYLGIMSAAFGVAAIVGPFVGGAFTDRSTWRWCFYINLPLGGLSILVCFLLVNTPVDSSIASLSFQARVRQFDFFGMVSLMGGIVCLLLALQWGGTQYPWNSGRIIALLVVAVLLMLSFVLLQIFVPGSKTIPRSVSKHASVWHAVGYAMCITGGIYVAIVYIPVWVQAVQHKSALGSGVMLTPLIVGYVVFSVIAGVLTSGLGYYNPPMILGTILASVALYGIGVGLGFGQPSYVVQTVLSETDIPIGVTLVTLVQHLSSAIFVAVAQGVFQNTLAHTVRSLAPGVDPSKLAKLGATQLGQFVNEQDMPHVLEAYSTAIARTLYIPMALSCASVLGACLTPWISMKKAKPQPTDQQLTRHQLISGGTQEKDGGTSGVHEA
ncbi:putative efflux pump antibiotic resistance protein [Aspergillus nomiae NRRL 13137]|uniref:Putative efflux pump antibiotic resistance protein n=1 Tax=Aspergillus nomiae NRRL (strain ATCC 15546 / NRRL 13137 / CBS 260.88 / M93) TaxID=1509407 RepID=A0A0L1JD38_ASPN3|nr:putative efflux pump antibiotic resistance protein [Aspergillus nomiae NRRL 13137]KNG89333.1 putative efflux pump antibiotic resistance protein [Aspergillus nomiae NRRL 13137]